MKLTIELVPETAWYSNMRKFMSKEKWDILRKQVYKQYNYHCGVCDATGMMNCHEIWEYDDENHIQTLKGFIALCTMCHHCKHIGLAGILADEGKLDYDAVIEHFCKVNECSSRQMDDVVSEAFEVWEKRSWHRWDVDLGKYENLVEKRGE